MSHLSQRFQTSQKNPYPKSISHIHRFYTVYTKRNYDYHTVSTEIKENKMPFIMILSFQGSCFQSSRSHSFISGKNPAPLTMRFRQGLSWKMAPSTPLFWPKMGGVEGPNFGVFSGPAFTHLKTAKIWNPTEPYTTYSARKSLDNVIKNAFRKWCRICSINTGLIQHSKEKTSSYNPSNSVKLAIGTTSRKAFDQAIL